MIELEEWRRLLVESIEDFSDVLWDFFAEADIPGALLMIFFTIPGSS
jgi:hypothetical protein